MFHRFISYCEEHDLFHPDEVLLLAVSGGIDSMVLASLFLQQGRRFSVAHCNFGLRGAESDGDTFFVEQWCVQHHIPFHLKRFDTHAHAHSHKASTQMAARDLRYTWFEELCLQHKYGKIVLAHHANDNAETVLINFTRGAGIKGLCGMQPKSGRLIRPLLFATRDEIVAYAKAHQIAFREDSSNNKTDYARNRIRHNVIPELCYINPSFIATSQRNARYLSQAAQIIAAESARILPAICQEHGDEVHISIAALLQTAMPEFWLFEILQPYNFSGQVVHDLLAALDGQSGKYFYSATHAALKDREAIIVHKLMPHVTGKSFLIPEDCTHLENPIKLTIEKDKYTPNFVIPTDAQMACIDAKNLQFPLHLRLWQEGDHFVPLGMQGEKKVSDFFIDIKLPLHQKQKQWVLCSGKDIVWLVGHRIDERYKITPQTKQFFIFRNL